MKFSDAEKLALRNALDETTEGLTVFERVKTLLPDAITDPADREIDAVATQKGNTATLTNTRAAQIPDSDYAKLFTVMGHLDRLANHGTIAPNAEIAFEDSLIKSRDILLSIIKTQTADLHDATKSLEKRTVRHVTKTERAVFTRRGEAGGLTEEHLEAAERGRHEANTTIFDMTLDNITCCRKMLAAFDTVQGIINAKRLLPDPAKLG